MPRLFSPDDLAVMEDVRHVFNPSGLCSPGKLLPTAGACGTESSLKKPSGKRPAF
jgi:glycolate oxidase